MGKAKKKPLVASVDLGPQLTGVLVADSISTPDTLGLLLTKEVNGFGIWKRTRDMRYELLVFLQSSENIAREAYVLKVRAWKIRSQYYERKPKRV